MRAGAVAGGRRVRASVDRVKVNIRLTRGSERWLAELLPYSRAIGWGPTAADALRDLADTFEAQAEHYGRLTDDEITPEGNLVRKLWRNLSTLATR